MDTSVIANATTWILPILFAITLHEAAHGYVARAFGDHTAAEAGRISINPLRHIDAFGTILLPVMLLLFSGGRFALGYAKPVPVNFANLNNPKRDMIWVALAGPGANIAMAILAIYLWRFGDLLPDAVGTWIVLNAKHAVLINILLAVFNMIPIPPLDGGRVAVGLLPTPLGRSLQRLEPYGLFLIIGLIFLLPWIGDTMGTELDFLMRGILQTSQYVFDVLNAIFGR